MWAVIQTVLVLAFLSYWLWRAEALYQAYAGSDGVETLERVDPIPDDLIAHARSYGSDWAQQQTLDFISEQHTKLGDWAKVRQSLGMTAGTM